MDAGDCEGHCPVGCIAVQSGRNLPFFRRICTYISGEPWRWIHTTLQDILKVKTKVIFYTFLTTILHTQYLLQTYELPEAGRKLWPKHIRTIKILYITLVINIVCESRISLRNIDNFLPLYTASHSMTQLFLP